MLCMTRFVDMIGAKPQWFSVTRCNTPVATGFTTMNATESASPEITALMTSLAANRLFGLRNGKSLSSASSARNASGTM